MPAAHYLIFDGAPKQAAIGAKIRDLSAGLAASGGRAGGPVAAGGGTSEALAEPLSEQECVSGGPLDCLLIRCARHARRAAKAPGK